MLTEREVRVLQLVTEGRTTRQIAREIGLATKSTEHMLGSSDPYRGIYRKIGVRTRAEAVAWYLRNYGHLTFTPTTAEVDKGTVSATSAPRKDQLGADLVEAYESEYNWIYSVRTEGSPPLAIEFAGEAANRLRRIIDKDRHARSTRPLSRLLGLILLQAAMSYREILLPHQVLPVTAPILREVFKVARLSADGELFGFACLGFGNAYYMMEKYAPSIYWHTLGLETVREVDMRLPTLREVALDWAYLGVAEKFMEYEQNTRSLVEEGNFSKLDQVVVTLEGLARGWGVTHAGENAFRTLEETRKVYSQLREDEGEQAPLREVQIIRCELQLMERFGGLDKGRFEALTEVALAQSRQHGYKRFIQTFEHMRTKRLG
jgi:DNA-binding CsgD family transcriptional regulator